MKYKITDNNRLQRYWRRPIDYAQMALSNMIGTLDDFRDLKDAYLAFYNYIIKTYAADSSVVLDDIIQYHNAIMMSITTD